MSMFLVPHTSLMQPLRLHTHQVTDNGCGTSASMHDLQVNKVVSHRGGVEHSNMHSNMQSHPLASVASLAVARATVGSTRSHQERPVLRPHELAAKPHGKAPLTPHLCLQGARQSGTGWHQCKATSDCGHWHFMGSLQPHASRCDPACRSLLYRG